MTPSDLLTNVVCPTLAKLAERWGDHIDSQPARLLLTAIAIQESGLRTRQQDGGPARGLWQFELNGVKAVWNSQAGKLVQSFCAGVTAGYLDYLEWIYDAIALPQHDDIACVLARALLLTDSKPLPDIGDEEGAWLYYQRNWRPGKPDRARWHLNYPIALAIIQESHNVNV